VSVITSVESAHNAVTVRVNDVELEADVDALIYPFIVMINTPTFEPEIEYHEIVLIEVS